MGGEEEHRLKRGRMEECVIDEETLELMVGLYRKGWFVRVWNPDLEDCHAALVDEYDVDPGVN